MTQATVPGYVYTVYTAEGCTVTAPGFTSFSVTCSPGMANSFTAPGDKVEISDPAATLVAVRTFNGALAALGLLGGGSTLPAGYTRLAYLESTGEQYINLNKIPDDETGGKLKGCYLSMEVPHGEPSLLGSYGYINSKAVRFWVSMLSNDDQNGDRRMAVGWNTEESIGEVVHEGDIVESSLNYKNSRKYTTLKNGVAYEKMLSGALQQSDSPLMFFAQKRGATIFCKTVGRIYNATISQGNAIESNFVPAIDPTGAPCMFDLVTRTPFYNAGTGDFVTPQAAARTYSLRGRRVLPDWGKLTPTGLRRLYHVPDGYQGDALQYAAEHGFCPIVEEEPPAEGYWSPRWEEIGGMIYLRWVETAPPEELETGKE